VSTPFSARLRRNVGEEIVHATRKLVGLCKRKVTGSNPVRGARWDAEATKRPFLLICRAILYVRKCFSKSSKFSTLEQLVWSTASESILNAVEYSQLSLPSLSVNLAKTSLIRARCLTSPENTEPLA